MNELALFAGAGGGLLSSEIIGMRTICAVERATYPASVLCARQNDGLLPPFPIWDDVQTFDGVPWRGIVDIITGGFPCQAYSKAAAGKNTADDLWPEMRRIVADVAPRYVFAENVNRDAINQAADDLELMGYKTKAIELSAADMGADHVRSRCWLFAYTDDDCEFLRTVNAETPWMQELGEGVWEDYPESLRMDDGLANRMDRLKAIGNGQVPLCAATAWKILTNAIVSKQ